MNVIARVAPRSCRRLPEPRFDHLYDLTTLLGFWEHADHAKPRPEHGSCTDDNARGLIAILREESDEPHLDEMEEIFTRFIQEAAISSGRFHNRRRKNGVWVDTIGSDDSQGRPIWAFGSLLHRAAEVKTRGAAPDLFERQTFESTSPRANAFAVLGAREVLDAHATNAMAEDLMRSGLLTCTRSMIPTGRSPKHVLPTRIPRISETMITSGEFLGDDKMIENGLTLLRWLLSIQKRLGHFSFTPVRGWAPGEGRPGFDQQPNDATAMTDACVRAWSATREASWLDEVMRAGEWLIGANDRRAILCDLDTFGCHDELTERGPNLNQGAEPTLASLSTLRQAKKAGLSVGPRSRCASTGVVRVGELR
ncbi:glycosyl transferase [soil metagenome]